MTPQEFDILFKLIEIVSIIGGGITVLLKVGRMAGSFETVAKQQATEILAIQGELKGLTSLVTQVAVQKSEIANVREDLSRVIGWYDELRHGVGLVIANRNAK